MTRTGPFERLKGLYPLTIIIAVLALSLQASPALSAGNCLQDEFSKTAKQTLGCTANDVSVASVSKIRHLDGTDFPACNFGETISFLADFTIVTTSKSSRSNVGLYFGTGGQGNALTGACTDSIIAPQHDCPTDSSIQCGSDNYHELDNANLAPGPDTCGDTSSTDNSPTAGAGSEVVTIEIDNFVCKPPAGQTQLVLPNCTSWQVPGKTTACESPSPDFPYPFDANGKPEAIPGSPSKCNCGTLVLNLQIQTPAVSVTKNCSTAKGDGTLPNPTCSLDDPGGTVTYTVDVKNTSNFGDVTLNQLCDSAYGNIATGNNPSCAGGNVGTSTPGGSNPCSLPQTIAQNGVYSCTFTANQPESSTVTDFASASGTGGSGGAAFGPTNSNTVTVTANEADSAAADIKTAASATPNSACATVSYTVEVDNSSLSGSDETESLSALNDSVYGDITSTHGSGNGAVVGTTCGVATGSPGLGTLSGSSGAGAFAHSIPVSGSYICHFDGKACKDLGPLNNPPNATDCAAGFEVKDTVSGTLTGDESETVSQTPGSLTADVCVSTTFATGP